MTQAISMVPFIITHDVPFQISKAIYSNNIYKYGWVVRINLRIWNMFV